MPSQRSRGATCRCISTCSFHDETTYALIKWRMSPIVCVRFIRHGILHRKHQSPPHITPKHLPRPVCQSDLHRRRRLCLIHLKLCRHTRPLVPTPTCARSSGERPWHARHNRHRRPKPVPSSTERLALGHVVLVRPLRHDHLHRLSQSHVQHRHRRTTTKPSEYMRHEKHVSYPVLISASNRSFSGSA